MPSQRGDRKEMAFYENNQIIDFIKNNHQDISDSNFDSTYFVFCLNTMSSNIHIRVSYCIHYSTIPRVPRPTGTSTIPPYNVIEEAACKRYTSNCLQGGAQFARKD
jgi:hypothetical protein